MGTQSEMGAQTMADDRLVAGRYRLQETLGRGGMGVVWSAEDEVLQRPVAVKEVLFPASVSDEERETLRERTLREARAAARLDHPCAVRVFDVVEDDDHPFIVMERLVGRTLSDAVHEDGPLAPARAAEIGLCLLDALDCAHEAGIIHRDVKPGNVLLRHDGRVTLTDFGIASTAGDSSITSTGLLLGSPAYIAPERARGGRPEPPSDLWSLGATLYTAVEGHPPFDKREPVATLTAVVTEPAAPCRRASGSLAAAIGRLLEKDPDRRATAAEVRPLLQAVTADPAAARAAPAGADDPPVETGGHTVALSPAGEQAAPASTRARVVALTVLAVVAFSVSATVSALLAGH